MSNQDENAAALAQFWNSTAPLSQVRENMNPENGWYDLFIAKLDPKMDDNGLIFIMGEFNILAPAGAPPSKQERYYVGTKKDPQALLPETRLNSPGFSRLKGIARVCDVPTNDQSVAQLCAALLGKSFTNRIESSKYKDKITGAEKEGCNLGRNPVKLGTVPARLDRVGGPAVVTNGSGAPVAPPVVETGAVFGNE